MFIIIFISVFVLGTIYLGYRYTHLTYSKSLSKIAVWTFLCCLIAIEIIAPIIYRNFSPENNSVIFLQWIAYLLLGLWSSLLIYNLIFEAILFFARWIRPISTQFVSNGLILIFVFAVFTCVIGIYQALSPINVSKIELPFKNIQNAENTLRIVQLSDLHIGPIIRQDYIDNVIKITNSLNPDLVFLTGDLQDGSVNQLRGYTINLKKLNPKFGIYFVPGNHEYYSGFEDWMQEYSSYGFKILVNDGVNLNINGIKLFIAGVHDYSAVRLNPEYISDPQIPLPKAEPGALKILLAHQPANYKSANGYDLMLSGHTHGGQYFPFNILVSIFQPYYRGLYKHNDLWIYTHRGTGFWGPPIRFGVPPEIALITIRKE